MYFQEVLFKPSWILASERDVRLMDAPFFLLVHSNKHDTRLQSKISLESKCLV